VNLFLSFSRIVFRTPVERQNLNIRTAMRRYNPSDYLLQQEMGESKVGARSLLRLLQLLSLSLFNSLYSCDGRRNHQHDLEH